MISKKFIGKSNDQGQTVGLTKKSFASYIFDPGFLSYLQQSDFSLRPFYEDSYFSKF